MLSKTAVALERLAQKMTHGQYDRQSASGKTVDEFLQDPAEKAVDLAINEIAEIRSQLPNGR